MHFLGMEGDLGRQKFSCTILERAGTCTLSENLLPVQLLSN